MKKEIHSNKILKNKEILIDSLLRKSKKEILDGKVSNFETILLDSKDKYRIF